MKILTIQNRIGIGDMVIFLPFIEAVAKKFSTPVYLLTKESSKASQILKSNKNIKEIIILDRNNNKNGYHDGLTGSLNLIKQLKAYNFDKIFIFNSSLRYNLIARFALIKSIYQYPLFRKKNQHIISTAQNFLQSNLEIKVDSNPKILVDDKESKLVQSKYNILNNQKKILLGIGGSGPTKRIPPEIFLKFMDECSNKYDCKFFLATGKNEEEQKILKKILDSKFKTQCIALDELKLSETLPVIKNCNIAICNDSSFSHLSAAVGIPTIVLMADTPLLYGSYSPQMHPILPDGEKTVTHDTLGKDKINPKKIFEKFQNIIN